MSKMKTMVLQDCFSLRARIGWQGLRADEFLDYGPYLVTGTDFVNGKVNWDTCYHVTEERFKQDTGIQLKENDLLVTKDGTIGKTAIVKNCPEKATLNSGVFVVRAINKSVVPAYLYYILSSREFDIFLANTLTGSTIKHLNQEHFYKFKFDVPEDTKEQTKIAEVLSTIDEAIDTTRCVIEKYRAIKAGLMQDLYDQLPEDCYLCLGEIADLYNGDRSTNYPKTTDIIDAGAVFMNAGHLAKGKVQWEVCDHISHEKFMSLHGAKIQPNDIIYCLRGTLGKNAFVENCDEATVASSLVVIRPKKVVPLYLFCLLNSHFEYKQRIASDNGTAQPNLSADSLRKFKFPIPEGHIQNSIIEKFVAMNQIIETEETTLLRYQDIKRGLMQDLLSQTVSVEPLM